jgi:ubiquinone/menaquinone biosynthesis C-methylase UbiE
MTTMTPPPMTPHETLSNVGYFSDAGVVLEYARAAANVGLWASERLLCERHFPKDAPLLELGCGAGRIAFGLRDAGWADIVATDFSAEMIEAARELNGENAASVCAEVSTANAAAPRRARLRFSVADATALPFPDAAFGSVIFGFNGLMMIPGTARRAAALREMRRVLRPGGTAIFTGHERDVPRNAAHWAAERVRWETGQRDPALEAFGDYNHATPAGRMFIRASTQAEVRELAAHCGFAVVSTAMRSEIAVESAAVREFSDDTRFWVLR